MNFQPTEKRCEEICGKIWKHAEGVRLRQFCSWFFHMNLVEVLGIRGDFYFLLPKRKIKGKHSQRERGLEAKIGALKERFKNLASSGQILDLPAPSGAHANSLIINYYMFGTSGEVIGSTAVARAKFVSRATPSTTTESVESLRARSNSPVNHINQVPLLLPFELADNVKFVSGCNSSTKSLNSATDMVDTLAAKCCIHLCAQQWSGHHQTSNLLRFFTNRALLHKDCPKHHVHKGNPGVPPETCGAVGERAQVILVWMRVRDVGNASYSWRLGVTRVRP